MADKKYLDNVGLGHTWDKIKAYLSGNYPTKSELTNGLAGKANSSHTHTSSQITDLKSNSIKPLSTVAGTNILPPINVGEMKVYQQISGRNVILPSGGQYMILFISTVGMNVRNRADVLSGGTTLTADNSNYGTISGFYIRLS